MKKSGTIYGLVLMGGKSTRMKKDKAMLDFHGQPQFAYCYDLLSRFCPKVFLSVRPGQTIRSKQKFARIVDQKQFKEAGPLTGILSAMQSFPKASWLILGCDLPFITEKTLEHLLGKRDRRKFATAYCSEYDGLPEPLCSIFEAKGRNRILRFFRKGVHCPRKIMINSNVKLLKIPVKGSLDNINAPDEYRAAVKKLRKNRQPGSKKIHLHYYAIFREQRGLSQETLLTRADTVRDLYVEIAKRFGFQLSFRSVRPAQNNEFVDWQVPVRAGDHFVFIPPVAGG